jgi:hypothetical protein
LLFRGFGKLVAEFGMDELVSAATQSRKDRSDDFEMRSNPQDANVDVTFGRTDTFA